MYSNDIDYIQESKGGFLKRKAINVVIDVDIIKKFDKIVKQRDSTRSREIRRLLKEFVEKYGDK